MTVYAVLFHVEEKKLATVLGALQGSAQLVSVTPTEVETPKATKEQYYTGGKRLKGISGEELVLKTLGSEKRPFHRSEIEKVFVANGFAAQSYSPTLSKLMSDGKIVSAGPGAYALKGTIVHLGASPRVCILKLPSPSLTALSTAPISIRINGAVVGQPQVIVSCRIQLKGSPTIKSADDLDIPAFLKREPSAAPQPEATATQQELPMRTIAPTRATDDAVAAEASDTEAPAKPAGKPRKAAAKPAKAASPANGAAKANGKAKVTAKGAKAPAKKAAPAATAKPVKAKAKKAERQRDPAKLDQWSFRKGSIKSKAAAMYAKAKGATLAEVKEEVGSVQFNLLTELKEAGHSVEVDQVKANGRLVNRYKLVAKD